MAIIVNRKSLSEALALALSCVEVKGTIPVLAFALFESKGGTVQITTTDLDVSMTVGIDAEGEDCELCVPAKQLSQLVALLRGETVSLEAAEDSERVRVVCEKAKHLLPSIKRDNFPAIEQVEGKKLIMKASALTAMLDRTAFAVTDEESRYAMRGVFLETSEAKLTAVGTDGFRLAQVKYPVPFSETVSAIVPLRAVTAILKAFNNEDPLSITFGEDKIKVSQDRTTITARTLMGTFPNYKMIIPKERKHKFTLGESAVISVKRAALTARTGVANNSPEIFFEVSKTSVGISSRDSQKGESEDQIEAQCDTLNGDSVRLGIASKQILDVLAREPEMEFWFDNNETAFKMNPTGLRDYEYVYVAMPVRLDV